MYAWAKNGIKIRNQIRKNLLPLRNFMDQCFRQGFQQDRTVLVRGTKRQKFLHCPRTKGHWDKPWDFTYSPCDGPVRNFDTLPRTGQDGIWTACPVPSRDETQNRRKERESGGFAGIFSAALIPGQRDSGTRKLFFMSRDKWTADKQTFLSRPSETLVSGELFLHTSISQWGLQKLGVIS